MLVNCRRDFTHGVLLFFAANSFRVFPIERIPLSCSQGNILSSSVGVELFEDQVSVVSATVVNF